MKNYIQKIRSKVGHQKIIHPAARIIVENAEGAILIIERADNGRIGIPAGAFEEGETIEECIKREVREETGLHIIELQVIGISSNPDLETVEYENGDIVQYFTVEFYAHQWKGSLQPFDREEARAARFVAPEQLKSLPANEASALESLHYFRTHNRIMLK
jgi:ADP-ribose pyrophosphatase YjhB (NUDIX family)